MWSLSVLLVLVAAAQADRSSSVHHVYAGNEVWQVELETAEQAEWLQQYTERAGLDVWAEGVAAGAAGARPAHVRTTPQQRAAWLDFLQQAALTHQLRIPDVQVYLEDMDSQLESWRRQRAGRLHPFDDFPRYDEVDQYLQQLAEQYPSLVTLVVAGNSFEGRPIKYLKISTTNFEDASKPVVFIDAMIHAREWVTTPTTLYALHRLLEQRRPEDEDLLAGVDWIVLPIVNPDGYEHTHTNARLWRKTRSNVHAGAQICPGVDANRNFDFEFGTLGVSITPCGETYPGESAFSEPETALVRDVLLEHLPRLQLYVNIHSYGNWMLYGYGNGSVPLAGAAALHHVGAAIGAAMDSVKLTQAPFYSVGNSALLLYATSGSAQDYAQSIGVPFSYTLELPSLGYFFQVPPQFINHINEETWRGLAAGARLASLYYAARS